MPDAHPPGTPQAPEPRRARNGVVRHGTTRQAVLRAAAEVFLEKGFADASIQEVAERVNIAKASAYYHVDSKESLLHEILVLGMETGIQRIREIQSYPLPAKDRLRLALRTNMNSTVENVYSAVAGAMAGDIRFLTPEHRAEYVARRDEYQAAVAALFDEAVARGEFRDIPGRHVALFAVFASLQTFRRWFHPDGGLTVNDVADIWWDMFTRGLEPR